MKELKITAPEGYEIDKDKSTFEHIIFKEKQDKEKEMSDFLFSMLNKTIREMTDKDKVTYYRASDNEWLFQCDCKNGILWVRYSLIWEVFETRFGLKYDQIRDFIAGWVEVNTEWRGLAPL